MGRDHPGYREAGWLSLYPTRIPISYSYQTISLFQGRLIAQMHYLQRKRIPKVSSPREWRVPSLILSYTRTQQSNISKAWIHTVFGIYTCPSMLSLSKLSLILLYNSKYRSGLMHILPAGSLSRWWSSRFQAQFILDSYLKETKPPKGDSDSYATLSIIHHPEYYHRVVPVIQITVPHKIFKSEGCLHSTFA